MTNSRQESNIPQGFIDCLRLLQYEQQKINQLSKETKRPDLREFLADHLEQCEKDIDKVHGLIKSFLEGQK